MAKRFLFVCLGLLCLALAYHVGARTARAQVGVRMVDFDWMGANSCYGMVAIDESGQLYEECGGTWRPTYRLSGTPVALKAESRDNRNVAVLMENGDLYVGSFYSNPVIWPPQFVTNVAAGATSTSQQTWGGLKAGYR